MSESGEISEFGYIMELLVRGKVSAGKSGAAAWAPTSGTTWPVGVGTRVIPGRGLGSRARAPSPCVPAAAECRVAAFSLLRGVSEMSQGGLSGVFEASGATAGAPEMARG